MAVTVAEAEALAAVRASIGACASDEEAGPMRLILPLPDQDCEVVVELPQAFRASPASRGALQVINGVGAIDLVH